MEYAPRMIVLCWLLYCNGDFVALSAENSPYMCICRNYMLILNSRSTTLNGGLEQLDGTVEAFLIAAWALKRTVLVDSLTWKANWFIVQFKVFIDFHCHKDRRLQSLTSRAPADQNKNLEGFFFLWRRARQSYCSRQELEPEMEPETINFASAYDLSVVTSCSSWSKRLIGTLYSSVSLLPCAVNHFCPSLIFLICINYFLIQPLYSGS